MSSDRWAALAVAATLAAAGAARAQSYAPPAASASLLRGVDFARAVPVDEGYRGQFVRCDGLAPDQAGIDTFRGYSLASPYRCSTDPSRVKALLRLADGGIYWDSKMALDVDGSWAAWSGQVWRNAQGQVISTTDLCGTWHKWRPVPDGKDCRNPDAQVDPDRFPYVVIPTAGLERITRTAHRTIGGEFRRVTGLDRLDMGVVIYRDRWTPVFIADGGPFMRLGEASPRVFEALGQSRCRKWNAAKTRCVGNGGQQYPYINSGIGADVIFILYPDSAAAGLTPANAIATICAFAREKLGLTGSPNCPS
jgi:hypothetical protein